MRLMSAKAMRREEEAVAMDAGEDFGCDAIYNATGSWVACAMRQAVAVVLPRHRGCERNRVWSNRVAV